MTDSGHKPLLPDFFKSPPMLLFTIILPQALLLALTAWTLWLVHAETSTDQLNIFAVTFAIQTTLIVLAGITWASARKQQMGIDWRWFLLLFFGQIGFLWYFAAHMTNLIPANIDRWIVDEGMLLFYAFSLMMPGVFYTGLNLACFELPITNRQNLGLSLLMTIAGPAFFYVFFIGGMMIFRGSYSSFISQFIYPALFIGFTVIAFVGITRLMVFCHNWISRRGDRGQMIFAIIVGLAGPLGGLTLNRQIPFPADFQTLSVYILAILNGVILLLPKNSGRSNGQLFLRCVFYPFTFYFFLVFLPFLPLALPAIFALGFGFLILVPVLLFILHTRKIADDFRLSVQNRGKTIALAWMAAGLAIMPVFFLAQAYSDKAAIKDAISYTYSPDYQNAQPFKGSLKSTRRALINLKKFKDGLQMPFLSDIYNRVVFEGMVLPDKKIARMYQLFTGEDIEKAVTRAGWASGRGGDIGLFPTRSRQSFGQPPVIDRNVSLESFQVQTTDEGEYRRAKVHLVMKNSGADGAEFLTRLNIPPGTVITGFQLKVDQEMVPGRIFERRTAQWVYHMIRDFVRRDPGILSYISPRQVELRIFPFSLAQQREAEIVFEFPAVFSPVVDIGDQTVSLTSDQPLWPNDVWTAQDSQGQEFVFIPKTLIPHLPTVKREPYFHFILDRSRSGLENLAGYAQQINSIAGTYPQTKKCRMTAANFSASGPDQWFDPHQSEAVLAALQGMEIPRQGGFDPERVIKTELLRYQRLMRQNFESGDWQTYPVFVILTPQPANVQELTEMAFYRDIIPERTTYLLSSGNNRIEERALWSQTLPDSSPEVIVLKSGRQIALIPADPLTAGIATFVPVNDRQETGNEISVFDAQQKLFTPVSPIKKFSASIDFINKLALLSTDKQTILNPAQKEADLSAMVKESKRLSVLTPSTSFIVVERDVQWKALQINEQKRLKTANAFEFEEDFKTPAPSFWLLMIGLGLMIFIRHWLSLRRMAK